MRRHWLLLLTIILFFPTDLFGFYSRGDVNNKIKYKDLKLYKIDGSLKVSGAFVNRTSILYSLAVSLYFCDIHGNVINATKTRAKILPHGEATFYEFLKWDDLNATKKSHHIEWYVDILEAYGEKKKKKRSRKTKSNRAGTSSVREKDTAVYIDGQGDHVTKIFSLPSGANTVKMDHDGDENFIVTLFHKNGDKVDLLLNEIGSINSTDNVSLKHSGSFFLEVKADGDWSIEIHKAKSDVSEFKAAQTKKKALKPIPNFPRLNKNKTIVLKNGRKIKVSSYKDNGNSIQFEQYGGVISFKKNLIEAIIE